MLIGTYYHISFGERVNKMASKHSKSNSKRWLIITFLTTFLFIFLLNYITYYTSDDYCYRFIYKEYLPTDSVEKINGIGSILTSQINHYFNWNGRFVAHSIVQFFMQYNKLLFDICNSIAFIILGILIYRIVSHFHSNEMLKKNKVLTYLLIMLLLWILIPEFGKSVLWVSGSGNYLWSGLIYTSLILYYIKVKSSTIFTVFGAILLGFLAGATNENSGPASILIIIMISIWDIISSKKISIWRISGILSSILGFIIMMKSPGSLRRGSMEYTFENIKHNFMVIYQKDVYHFFFGYLILIIIISLLVYQKRVEKKDIVFTSIFLVGHFAGIYCLILSPSAPLRTFFGPAIFLIISIIYLFCKIEYHQKFKNILVAVLLFYSLISYAYAFQDIHRNYIEVNEQVEILKNSSSDEDVKLKILTPSHSLTNPYNGTTNLSTDSNAWFNLWMAEYYNVKSITGVPSQ